MQTINIYVFRILYMCSIIADIFNDNKRDTIYQIKYINTYPYWAYQSPILNSMKTRHLATERDNYKYFIVR